MKRTVVKDRIAKKLQRVWSVYEISRMAGVAYTAAAMELTCTGKRGCTARHTPCVQDAIAKAVRMSTAALFGKHAWFKLAGRALQQRRASA